VGFKSRRTFSDPAGMDASGSPVSPEVDSPAKSSYRRPAQAGTLLLIAGIYTGAVAALWEGFLIVYFFGGAVRPFTISFNAFEWGQAYTTIFFGLAILLLGLGWTLNERGRLLARTSMIAAPRWVALTAGSLLVILGTLIAATGELVTAANTVSGLEGGGILTSVLGPGWSTGLPDVVLGVGLLLAGTGVLVLWRA
jgi:hypothetical protein